MRLGTLLVAGLLGVIALSGASWAKDARWSKQMLLDQLGFGQSEESTFGRDIIRRELERLGGKEIDPSTWNEKDWPKWDDKEWYRWDEQNWYQWPGMSWPREKHIDKRVYEGILKDIYGPHWKEVLERLEKATEEGVETQEEDVLPPGRGAAKVGVSRQALELTDQIVVDGKISGRALGNFLRSGKLDGADELVTTGRIKGDQIGVALKITKPDVERAIREGESVVVDLDVVQPGLVLPSDVLANGIKAYALYDQEGNLLEVVFVRWGENLARAARAAVSAGTGVSGWVRVMFQKAGKALLSVGEKLETGIDRMAKWACGLERPPKSVTVTIGAQFGVGVAGFTGSAAATYAIEDLCAKSGEGP